MENVIKRAGIVGIPFAMLLADFQGLSLQAVKDGLNAQVGRFNFQINWKQIPLRGNNIGNVHSFYARP